MFWLKDISKQITTGSLNLMVYLGNVGKVEVFRKVQVLYRREPTIQGQNFVYPKISWTELIKDYHVVTFRN